MEARNRLRFVFLIASLHVFGVDSQNLTEIGEIH